MQTFPLPRILRQALRANRAHGFVYLNNPKVGCSTVKTSLWCATEGCGPADIPDVHALEGSPFEREIAALDWAGEAFVFTFVRNPYARIVSAWRNKVVAQSDTTWASFARRHGRDPAEPTDFDAFVAFIAAIHRPTRPRASGRRSPSIPVPGWRCWRATMPPTGRTARRCCARWPMARAAAGWPTGSWPSG